MNEDIVDIAINTLIDRFCDTCDFGGNSGLFCKNSKRKEFEIPEERTCKFWEAKDGLLDHY
jgi:hypothetical protein